MLGIYSIVKTESYWISFAALYILTTKMVCIKCKEQIKKDDWVVTCDSCCRTIHRECSDLNASELKVMDLKGKRTLRFYCEDCQAGLKLIPTLIAKIDKLESQINAPRRDNININQSMPLEEHLICEIHERQKRAKNVVIYNLPESNNDLNEVKKISKEVTNIDIDVVRVIRFGKPNKNGHRPMKATFGNPDDAMSIIVNRKKIAGKKRIYLETDMTPSQASKIRQLKQELNDRRSKGENIVIKYFNGTPKITPLN